jgi:chorismate lyase / 3-hydroxybenzoate synthase
MNAAACLATGGTALRPRYVAARDPRTLLGPDTLAVFGFGDAAPRTLDDPRYLHVALQPLQDVAPFEVWHAASPVQPWRAGALAGATSAELEFGWIECAETDGIAAAAEQAYRAIVTRLGNARMPHLLRMWNYFDAITAGEGDAERYRQFCVGRVAGLRDYAHPFPAGTAIGRRDGRRTLQVYWLAARDPGQPLENPRQVPAWDYPRQYGPRPPSFARAMLGPAELRLPLMLSGTAAVVGHASHHPDDIAAQLQESFRNFDALLTRARGQAPALPERFGGDSLLKVYLRHAHDTASVEAQLDNQLDAAVPRLLLQAEVCRRELLIEIDGFHGG